ncbi:hypothetical protein Taro_038532 [Colocasia esculenta]|uniref:Trichome birefringence-like N-terminal domain-containing protein n=1 Tax=Colocasia esculenta TaxID=4460 RepID=A0A843WG49_COLES|nr:hypothetical protein [Colocasia esculenta]
MDTTKGAAARGRTPLSIMVVVICALAFAGILFTEDLRALTGTPMLKLTVSCFKQGTAAAGSTVHVPAEKEEVADLEDDYKEEKAKFDPGRCRVTEGKWVFNSSGRPLYSDSSCPYLDKAVSCMKNGRPDGDHQKWEWQLDDCNLPRFDPAVALEKLRGKRLMFAGDSLQRGQWLSFVCMVEFLLPSHDKSMKRSRSLSIFTTKEYNASIAFYWAPFLVESNSDVPIIADANKRILRLDSISKHAKHWSGVDILVFNTYVWWMSGQKIKSLWGSFPGGEEGYEELDPAVAYRIGLRTWANWVDSTMHPNQTRVFFTTMSPTHMRSSDWYGKKGMGCHRETKPVMEKGHWGSGSDRRMMEVVASVVGRMRLPVAFLNITQLSEYRKDGHTSVYYKSQEREHSAEQKEVPRRHADCIHWCLPGVPDTWNRILFSYL